MNTIRFGPRDRESDPLLARVGELPRDVAPAEDLWPGIAARLDEKPAHAARRAFGWPQALAAGLLVAAVSALLTWGLMREPAPAPGDARMAADAAAPAGIVPVRYGPNSPLGAAQLAARDELLAQFHARLPGLKPETREAVARNLAIIQRAADEIDAALAEDPASGLLNELLLGAYRQELQLYSRLVTTGDGPTRRT